MREKRTPVTRHFNYSFNYRSANLRENPKFYRVGKGEQGVLLVEPYKSEILPHWRFKTPKDAQQSARRIFSLFKNYKIQGDFIGMDMARKFLQMGYTRSRRYANHPSGRKYDDNRRVLPRENDAVKAESARIFKSYWDRVERDPIYKYIKGLWKKKSG